jgi:hypothetical protein
VPVDLYMGTSSVWEHLPVVATAAESQAGRCLLSVESHIGRERGNFNAPFSELNPDKRSDDICHMHAALESLPYLDVKPKPGRNDDI